MFPLFLPAAWAAASLVPKAAVLAGRVAWGAAKLGAKGAGLAIRNPVNTVAAGGLAYMGKDMFMPKKPEQPQDQQNAEQWQQAARNVPR